MTDNSTDWNDKTFLQKAIPLARVHFAEYIGAGAQETRLLGHLFDKAGHLLPEKMGGPAVGKALAVLCNETGKGMAWLSDKIRGGYQIEGLPKAAQFLPRMWKTLGDGSDRIREYLTPEHIDGALNTYGRVSDALKKIKPDLKLPDLSPAVA